MQAAGKEASLTVSPTEISASSSAAQYVLTIDSNVDWEVSEGKSWISVTPTSGSAGTGKTVTVTVNANTTTSSRTGYIYIDSVDNAVDSEVVITQAAPQATTAKPTLTVNSTCQTMQDVTFTASGNTTAMKLWIMNNGDGSKWSQSMTKSGTTFSCVRRFTDEGTKTVWVEDADGVESDHKTITVSASKGLIGAPVITPGSLNATVGESVTIQWNSVTDAISYTAYVKQGDSMVADLSDKISGRQVSYTFTSAGSYQMEVYATGQGYNANGAGVSVTVTAASVPNTLSVDKGHIDGLIAEPAGGPGEIINVTSNTAWTIRTESSWIHLTETGGNGNGSFSTTTDVNGGGERIGYIYVEASGCTTITIKVTQEAASTEASGKPGDVNGDDKIGLLDVVLLLDYVVGRPIAINVAAADVNDDGKVGLLDVVLLLDYVVGRPIILK